MPELDESVCTFDTGIYYSAHFMSFFFTFFSISYCICLTVVLGL